MKLAKDFVVKPKSKFILAERPTAYTGEMSKEEGVEELEKVKKHLSVLQEKLYAGGDHSVLVIIQAMDAGGKDSLIEHVFSGINPQGCQVKSFKTPNAEEYSHDFLWRHYRNLPPRGMIGIHNRSHYESVLICKVHPEFILKERIPGYQKEKLVDEKFWKDRYESIRDFEQHQVKNGTLVLKFFLNISKDVQKERFLERIETKEKYWKFLEADLDERELWSKYMDAYETAIKETSTKEAPWFVIPADKKWYARLTVATIIEAALEKLDLEFPATTAQEATMEEAKARLLKE